MSQLSLSLNDFVCQYKEQRDELGSQLLEMKQSLDQLLELPQKVEQVEHEVEILKKQVADLSRGSEKREEHAKQPTFFGALDRNEYFTGRKVELESLRKAFEGTNTTPNVSGAARRKGNVRGICGLGGCGKSSLAFEYAWRNLELYPGGIFVVSGESDELMRASFQRIYGEFVVSAQSNQHEEAKPFEQVLNETLSWLGNLREKWLLLVDNMDQKELSFCPRTVFLGQWKSKTSCDILVTSRRNSQTLCEDLHLPSENCFELDPFRVDEAVEFLKKRTGIPSSCDDQDQEEKKLAQELGGLPLALEQAAAYIKALKCSIQSYRQQYYSQKSALLNAKNAKPSTEIYSEDRLAVQTTWLLNFNYIASGEKDQGLGKAASLVMKIAAYLSPDEILIDIFNIGIPSVENEDLKNRLKMPIGAEQIVDLLVRFSLFKRRSDDTLSIHRLVQETLRDRCDGEGETDKVLSTAIRMMHHAFRNCASGTDVLYDLSNKMASINKISNRLEWLQRTHSFFLETTFDARRWKKLPLNAFHLVCHLLRCSSLKPLYFCEESARLFFEAALYCYYVGVESLGYRLQQVVLEIFSAINEPIRYYKDGDLSKVTRVFLPTMEWEHLNLLTTLRSQGDASESGLSDIPVHTNQAKELSEAIEVIAPKAREAFGRGDFQIAADLYSDIIKVSNFSLSSGTMSDAQPHLVPVGEILCFRGTAYLKMGKFEMAVDDFNASICVDTQHYRGYYWKAYTICKLVQSGRTEFTSRAQAATAVLLFKFGNSKSDDIQKLQKKFPRLLDKIEYKFVSEVSYLNELERLPNAQTDFPNCPLTVILAKGCYELKEMSLLGGQYYFVCPPGPPASLYCTRGLYLSRGSFLFENIVFVNSPFGAQLSTTREEAALITSDKPVEESFGTENVPTITLGRTRGVEMELAARSEQNPQALIEAYDIHSLVIDHCVIVGANCSGIVAKSDKLSQEQRNVVVWSSIIHFCNGTGLALQGDAPFSQISIHGSVLDHNLYGLVIDCPSNLHLEENNITYNRLSGVVIIGAEGKLLKNVLIRNEKHGILFSKTKALIENNVIVKNVGWGIVGSCESNLQCKENKLLGNFCGGINLMLNGRGNVLVERCELRENSGLAIFPASADQLCQVKLEWNKLLAAPHEWKKLLEGTRQVSVFPYLLSFVEHSWPICESSKKFNPPVLVDNRVSDGFVNAWQTEPNVCSACYKDVQVDINLIQCPSCHVAKYCSKQCYDSAKALHSPVCKSILEANKLFVEYCEFRKLGNVTLPVHKHDRSRADLSLCVVVTFPATLPSSPQCDYASLRHVSAPGYLCLLTCPQAKLWTFFISRPLHRYILTNGRHLPDHMMHMKAGSILANLDSESNNLTVFCHRVFPLKKVPDALKWAKRTMDEFGQLPIYASRAQGGYTIELKNPPKASKGKRRSR